MDAICEHHIEQALLLAARDFFSHACPISQSQRSKIKNKNPEFKLLSQCKRT